MTVGNLIEKLSKISEHKIVVMTEPSGIGWTNIGKIEDCEFTVKIIEDDTGLFHDS